MPQIDRSIVGDGTATVAGTVMLWLHENQCRCRHKGKCAVSFLAGIDAGRAAGTGALYPSEGRCRYRHAGKPVVANLFGPLVPQRHAARSSERDAARFGQVAIRQTYRLIAHSPNLPDGHDASAIVRFLPPLQEPKS